MDPMKSDSFAHLVAEAIFENRAHETVKAQIGAIETYRQNREDIDLGRTKADDFDMPSELLAHHAILFFQCDEKIAKKIAHLKNEHGQPLIHRDGIELQNKTTVHYVNLWNAKTQSYDCYEEIAAECDPKTGFQGAAYFDHQHRRMTFNFGGTDFTNARDLFVSGGQMMAGKVDNRMTKVIPFVQKAMHILQEYYGDDEILGDAPIDIAGHSTGTNAAALAKYCIETQFGRKIRSTHLIEPTGAINAYQHTAKMVAEAGKRSPGIIFDDLADGAVTYKSRKKSFIGWFPKLSQNVGDISLIGTNGNSVTRHMGAAWINAFMDEARQITQRTPAKSGMRNILKHEATA